MTESGAKKTEAHAGVPFRLTGRKAGKEPGYAPYMPEDFNSPLWETYRGAYGSIYDYIVTLMSEKEKAPEVIKLRRLDNSPKTNYEIAFDNLCENLCHQMSFYPASWLALPYLAMLMEDWEKERDLEWTFRGILMAGSCLATDVFGDRPAEAQVFESWENAALHIRVMTINFLAEHLAYVLEKEPGCRQEFAVAVTAILGEKKFAYMLFLSAFASCYIGCPSCEFWDEDMEFGDSVVSERIQEAESPTELWDGESLEDAKLWLFNLFALLKDQEGQEKLRCYFGTYTCPECGERIPVLTGMEEYYFSE